MTPDVDFADFAAAKEREALGASLAPWTTEIEAAPPAGAIAVGNAWSRALFDGDFRVSMPRSSRLPATSLVFVESRDGNTVAKNPSALGGGETDKHLIYEGLSRVAADAVLAGAETVRSGRIAFSVWHPELVALRRSLGKPRHPIQIVATLRGIAFDTGLLWNEPSLRVVLLTVPQCSSAMHHALVQRPWVTPVIMERPDRLNEAFEQLRRIGIETISCVGGRTLARQLIDAALVQDLYLTRSPRAGGEPGTPMYPGSLDARLVVRKKGTRADEGVIFEQLSLT